MRTILPFCHTASGRSVFLCRSTTSLTAFFNAISALSCKDILFFISYLFLVRLGYSMNNFGNKRLISDAKSLGFLFNTDKVMAIYAYI